MKKGKKVSLLLAAALVLSLFGCGGVTDWDAAQTLIGRAREVGSSEKEASILQEFLKKCKDADEFEKAAEYYENSGQPDEALEILLAGAQSLQKRKDSDSEQLTEDYFELLAQNEKLENVRQNAPDLSAIPVNGKPFSEYSRESLLALIPTENINYVDDAPEDDYYYYDAAFRNVNLNVSGSTDETYPHYSISFYDLSEGRGSGKGEGPEPVLPDGITLTSSFADCLTAMGFDAGQVKLLQDYTSVTVYLGERDMDFYVYDYSPGDKYRYFQMNYALRAYDGSIGFNFTQDGLESYELSWSS